MDRRKKEAEKIDAENHRLMNAIRNVKNTVPLHKDLSRDEKH